MDEEDALVDMVLVELGEALRGVGWKSGHATEGQHAMRQQQQFTWIMASLIISTSKSQRNTQNTPRHTQHPKETRRTCPTQNNIP